MTYIDDAFSNSGAANNNIPVRSYNRYRVGCWREHNLLFESYDPTLR